MLAVDQTTHNQLIAHLHTLGEKHEIVIGGHRANRLARGFLEWLQRYQGDKTPGQLFASYLQRRLRLTTAARHRIEADPEFARVVQHLDKTGEQAIFNVRNPDRAEYPIPVSRVWRELSKRPTELAATK